MSVRPHEQATWFDHVCFFTTRALLGYKAVFAGMSPYAYVLTKVVSPLMQIVLFTYVGIYLNDSRKPIYYVTGNAIQICCMAGIYGVTTALAGERDEGTLPHLVSSPVNRLVFLGSKHLMYVVDGLLTAVLGFVLGAIFLDFSFKDADVLGVLAAIVAGVFATSGLGLALGSLSLIYRETNFVSNMAYYILLALCGTNFPIEAMPTMVQWIARCLPLTHAIKAGRLALSGETAGLWATIGIELLVGTVWGLVGYVMLLVVEKLARKGDTLEIM